MSDYAELLKQLRFCPIPGSCHHCIIDADKCHRRTSKISLYLQAVVAIEELLAAVPHWISVEEQGLPKTYFRGIPSQEEFLVVVAKRWSPRDEWEYHTDTALNWGTYIDDFWDTQNDWHEGEEVHVVAYMPFPDPLRIPPKEVE